MKETVIFLHGLFGGLSNWQESISHFEKQFEVYVPAIPIYDEPEGDILDYFVDVLNKDLDALGLHNVTLVGNSLGGHVAILYANRYPQKVKRLVLTGSSGLYENYIIGSFPRRRDRSYVRKQVENVFYNPEIASDQLVNEVFDILSDNHKCFRIIKTAKTTQRNYVTDLLPTINIPVLLIWGEEDTITPPGVAEEFRRWLPQADLRYLPECGHAPMMEQPGEFNTVLEAFLRT